MSKQTAVEFYRTELSALVSMKESKFQTENEIFERAKAMHKEEIQSAWYDGIMGGQCGDSEQYYNETYGGQDE
jgi:hypothetical protein